MALNFNKYSTSLIYGYLCLLVPLPFLGSLLGPQSEMNTQLQSPVATRSKVILREVSSAISGVTQEAIPAVVSVRCYTTTPEAAMGNREMSPESIYEEFLQRFFGFRMGTPEGGRKAPPIRRPPIQEEPQLFAFGSGFLISDNGYAVTNAHVVKSADKITVLMYGEELERNADLIGLDLDTDLAVLRIEGEAFPSLDFGDSDLLQIGELVIAIGNAHQWTHSVTMGVVSAKGRENLNLNLIEEYIQTDAAINLGNSGGPLLDADGKVIGVNTAFASTNGQGSIGIGFAIPSNLARTIAQQIIEEGTVRRGFLGVVIKETTQVTAEAYGLEKPEGFIVTEVMPESAAEKAGIKAGDILLRVNKVSIKNFQHLRKVFSIHKPGTEVIVTLFRNGAFLELPVVLAADSQEQTHQTQTIHRLGFSLENHELSWGNNKKDQCIKIKEVLSGSPAEVSGLEEGNIILLIDLHRVHSVTEFKRRLAEIDPLKTHILLLVSDQDGKNRRNVSLQLQRP